MWLILQHILQCSQSGDQTHTHTHKHALLSTFRECTHQPGWADILTHACRHTQLCSISPCLRLEYAHTQPVTVTGGCCCLTVTAEKQDKEKPAACMQTHTNEIQKRLGRSLVFSNVVETVRGCAHWIGSFALTDSLIFADVLPPTLKHCNPIPPTPPHLFSFHQQDFKAHFVSSATVPPFLPTSLLSLLLLQPSPTAGGEIISNTPSLVLASPPFLVSLQPFSQHLPHSASCLSLFSFFTFLPFVC